MEADDEGDGDAPQPVELGSVPEPSHRLPLPHARDAVVEPHGVDDAGVRPVARGHRSLVEIAHLMSPRLDP